MLLAAALLLSPLAPSSPLAQAPPRARADLERDAPVAAAARAPRDLAELLRADARCRAVLDRASEHRLQILLAEPVERADGGVQLLRSRLGDPDRYFYPASSIKLCGAVALLLELNAHNRAHGTALGLSSELVIEPRFEGDRLIDRDDSNVVDGSLTVRHMLRKLFLVSDNQAYNHCLELLGQDRVNRAMWSRGFDSVRLWHRLSEARTRAENRQTRTVRCDDTTFEAREAGIDLDNARFTDRELGAGYLAAGQQIAGPMSFDRKNAILLRDLQDLLAAVVRPEIAAGGRRGWPGLTVEQRAFLVRTLGQLPRESDNPRYDPAEVPDHACKFILRGVRQVVPAEHLRIYDKIGRAYGFSTENAYVEDRRTGRGFFLAITLYSNPNGILNDDRYGYAEIAEPFLDAVGETIARAVLMTAPR